MVVEDIQVDKVADDVSDMMMDMEDKPGQVMEIFAVAGFHLLRPRLAHLTSFSRLPGSTAVGLPLIHPSWFFTGGWLMVNDYSWVE